MLFTEFKRKNYQKFGIPNGSLLSPECRVPKRDENKVSESSVKSGEAELCHAFFRYFVCKPQLKEFFKVAGRLTERSAVVAPSAHARGCGRSHEDFRLQQ